MPRLSVSLTPAMHKHLSLLSAQHNLSISNMINHLLQVGAQYVDNKPQPKRALLSRTVNS